MKYAHFITYVRHYAELAQRQHKSYGEQVHSMARRAFAQGSGDFGGGKAQKTATWENLADIVAREYSPSDASVPQTVADVQVWLEADYPGAQ